jgi:hypothetical protein
VDLRFQSGGVNHPDRDSSEVPCEQHEIVKAQMVRPVSRSTNNVAIAQMTMQGPILRLNR